MLKSTDSASCKPTSDCYAESFVQSESHDLSTNLPMLHRVIEIWKKDCFVIMSMNLPVLTLEKNWINQRSCCTRPGVETGSRITLPLELNDSTLSSSCLKAVSPLSMLDTAWEAVLSRLLPWEKQSRSEDFKQIDSESWHSQRLEHISLDRLLLQYCNHLGRQWHVNSDLECQQIRLSGVAVWWALGKPPRKK